MPLHLRHYFKLALDVRALIDLAEAAGLIKLPGEATLACVETNGYLVFAHLHCKEYPAVFYEHPGLPEAPLYIRYSRLIDALKEGTFKAPEEPPAVLSGPAAADPEAVLRSLWKKAVDQPGYDRNQWEALEKIVQGIREGNGCRS